MSSELKLEAGYASQIEAVLNHGVGDKATNMEFMYDDQDAIERKMISSGDGKHTLVPQPSEDPDDPLNWSSVKKHSILLTVAAASFLPNYGSATGAAVLEAQSIAWGMTVDEVNHSQSGNVFMVGAGGIFVVVLSAYFGRLPVLFWFTALTCATAIWCTAATTFKSFMAARILNGFFSSVGEAGGLMFIKDMFFFHEHARKINIWASLVILSPYLGPMFSAFITIKLKWQWAFAIYSIMSGLCLLAIVLFGDETYYDRTIPRSEQPPRGSQLMRLVGISQWRSRKQRSTFAQAVARPFVMIIRLPIVIAFTSYVFSFAWVIGINTTISIFLGSVYDFGQRQIGLFYFTPIIALILSDVSGHWAHNYIATIYTRLNSGQFHAEGRLGAMWLAMPLQVAGLVVLGFALQHQWHYLLAALGWGMYVFGIMFNTVAITAYCLDSYPEASGETNAWLSFARTLGGFVISYFQIEWVNTMGAVKTFGTQAGLCVFAFMLVVGLQVWGKKLRELSGHPNFQTS